MKIKILGAAGEVTGSNYLVTSNNGGQILVDAGAFQGEEIEKENVNLPEIDLSKINGVILTHGHLDHCGRTPQFVKAGLRSKIYGTLPTLQLAQVLWEDSARLMNSSEVNDILYTKADIEETKMMLETLEYRRQYKINSFHIELFNTSHIIGSSGIIVNGDGQTIVFSSDLGNTPDKILATLDNPTVADTLVLESTYGNKTHQPRETCRAQLKEAILQIIKDKSTLLIPAFAIERSQELLYDIDYLIEDVGLKPINAFLDSPMAIKVTDIYRNNIVYLSDEVNRQVKQGDDPFTFIKLKFTETVSESKMINSVQGPKIIIAGSGMMDGGRIQHHLKRVLPDPSNLILIVGYQVPGTLGRKIEERYESVFIDGRQIDLRAQTKKVEAYSAHADMPQLIKWAKNFNPEPRKIILTHGEANVRQDFKSILEPEITNSQIVCPMVNDEIDVDANQ